MHQHDSYTICHLECVSPTRIFNGGILSAFKGNIEGAERTNFDDSKWTLVSLPNGIETLPIEASGCINYQGEVWYRKHFTPEEKWKGKRTFLHFENDEPIFAQRVYSDIRNMVRRDRNHPSVWMWEPILNETWYPEDFAKNVVNILHEEYPCPYCYAGCDVTARGSEYFPVHFTHPVNGAGGAFNIPMLVQAQGYAKTDYHYTCYDALYKNNRQHVGGCLWHSFDHQRGYHPDPFYGGIMDAFRQPKLSYYIFCSQRPAEKNEMLISDNGPMVYIANAMTPFSPKDVTVYSNCDEVRLTYCKDGKQLTYKKDKTEKGMPSPIITFENVWDVMYDKKLARSNKHNDSYLLAEGLVDGKVVATHKVMPTRRPSKLILWTDNEHVETTADGSDLVTVIAAVADDKGNIKRLNNSTVYFEFEGPGTFVADGKTGTNPRIVEWGTAPILVRATTNPGEIKVKARLIKEGKHTATPGEIIIRTKKSPLPLIADPQELHLMEKQVHRINENQNSENESKSKAEYEKQIKELQQQINRLKLKEVEQQQSDFE